MAALMTAAGLHLGDLRIGDGQTAAAVTHHGVELVQGGDDGLDLGVTVMPISLARARCPPPRWATNSCSGGSRKRMVTGSPPWPRRCPRKSPCCMGCSLARAFSRCSTVSEQIISRMAGMRSASKNMCSVRHRPMPSAPNFAAWAASWGCRRWCGPAGGDTCRPSP